MPYCQNCGSYVSEGTKFCASCGSSVVAKTPVVSTQGTLVFIRQPSSAAKAIKTKVIIDGLEYGQLKENERLEVSLPFGTHTVTLKCALNPALTQAVQIGSTNNVFFTFKIGMNGKPKRIAESVGNSTASNPKKRSTAGIIAIIAVVLLVIFIISRMNNEPDTNNTTTTKTASSATTPRPTATPRPTPAPTPSFTEYTDSAGIWEITVNDFSYKNSISVGLLREYRSEDGSKYCVINLTVKNIGKEAATFLPYISWGDEAVAKIKWKDYEYIRSELLFVNDTLSSETLNPLVSTTGDIVFELPDEIIESDTPPVLVITAGGKKFTCELVKTITP